LPQVNGVVGLFVLLFLVLGVERLKPKKKPLKAKKQNSLRSNAHR